VDYLNVLRQRLVAVLDQRAAAKTELDALLDAVAVEQRSDLTDVESTRFDELRSRIAGLDEQRKPLEQRIGEIEAEIAAAEQAAEALGSLRSIERPAYDRVARVTAEPSTYRSDNAHEVSFVRDLAFRSIDPSAPERLARHANESRGIERRDGAVANYAGLVVPQYLTDLVAPIVRGTRVIADRVTAGSLPAAGMTVNISRITTGSSVALQSSENSAVSETDIDDTLLTVNVRTLAGMQDVSRQAIDRGTGIDQVIVADLAAAYAAAVESHIISHGTDGILSTSGINAVTYTDASPTLAELYPKLADAIQQVQTNRLLGPTSIYMHPRRWAWMLATLDSTSRPFVVPNAQGPFNAVGVNGDVTVNAPVGSLMGLPVFTDSLIPTNLGGSTNEDRIIVTRDADAFLWEEAGSPMRMRVDEPGANTLTIRYVLFGYLAFTAGRYPTATSVIAGTGLATPSF
jgi:HK97 family phage major capsid protein